MVMSLEDLRNRISKCTRCGKNRFWNFPTLNGVKGFHGDKDHIFAASQPHLGEFPKTPNDRRLYSNMAKYGFEEAHLTDVVKCRGTKFKKLSKIEVDNCIGWLDEEVRIVNPKAIIALGQKAYNALISKPCFRPILWISHYSHRISDADYEKEFETLRHYLDMGKYRHGMKIKDLITPEQRRMEERRQKFSVFVESLDKKGVEGKERREAIKKWNKENP